jgi:hypothetical protein
VNMKFAYYTAANALHYPGLVALVNSIRLSGETEPIFVVDCGLTDSQQETLEQHVTFVTPDRDLHPVLQKATGPLAHPAEHMVILDSDIIVTRPLSALVDGSRTDRLISFVDSSVPNRFFPDWSALGLGEPRQQPYVNAGLLVLSAEIASHLLPLLVELQERLDMTESLFGRTGDPTGPYYYLEQDLLNTILMTSYDGRVLRLDGRLAPHPPFPGLRVVDTDLLRCAYSDSAEPYVLHHTYRKPWLVPMTPTPYSRLFIRAVGGTGILVRIPDDEVALRLRDGALGGLERRRVSLQLKASGLRSLIAPRHRLERLVYTTLGRRR